MKRFFYFFLLFLIELCPCTNGWSATPSDSFSVEINESPSKNLLTDFKESVYEKIQHAKSLKPSEISLVEHPQNMNLYTFITLMEKDAGLFTGEKGLGNVHTFEFGQARLVSCMGNLNHEPALMTALLVVLQPDWILKKPDIPVSQSQLWETEMILYPFRAADNGKQTKLYNDMVLFPIVYTLKETNTSFNVEKKITLTACKNENCLTETRLYQLTVEPGKGYQTDVCPAILHEFYASPKPLPDAVQAAVHQNEDGFIQVSLDFPESVSDIELLVEHSTKFTLRKKFVNDKRVNVIFEPEQPIEADKPIRFNVLSSFGLFQFEAIPDHQPFVMDTPDVQWSALILKGVWFFLFSPFYLLFWSLRPKQKEELVHVFAFVSLNLIGFAVLAGYVLYAGVPVLSFFPMPVVLLAQTVLMTFILIKPFIKMKGLTLLMLAMPYPFLYHVSLIFPAGQVLSAFGIAFWWAFCAFVPFWLTYRHVVLFQSMAMALTPIRKLIRLPAVLMFAWMVFASVLSITQTNNIFSESALEEALKAEQSVFVSVYNAPCLTCAVNQIVGKYMYPTNKLFMQNKIKFMQINQNTALGQAFLKKYNIKPGVSFYMLYGPIQKYGLRIENNYIQPEKWIEYLQAVGQIPNNEEIEIKDPPIEDTPIDPEKVKALIIELSQEENK